MNLKIKYCLLFLTISFSVVAQKTAMELSFSAIDSAAYVQLDSIKVMNRTQACDTVLIWPDTVLLLNYQVGINNATPNMPEFQLFQNYPNPAGESTTIAFVIPEKDQVKMIISDVNGRILEIREETLEKAHHRLSFVAGDAGLYIFTLIYQGKTESIRIMNAGIRDHSKHSLTYIGSFPAVGKLKNIHDNRAFCYNSGDMLLMIGYIGELESGLTDSPDSDSSFIFQFAYNIPCPGIPYVSHGGSIYYTTQVFSQCWFNRNLNLGTMISGSEEMTDNEIIEKYCYDDNIENCYAYGGLYQWDEMMDYISEEGSQGLCPEGWHIATDEEFKLLQGAADSQYGIGDSIWDGEFEYHGFDAGNNLKSGSGWYGGYNGSDLYGFNTKPTGRRIWNGQYNTLTTVSWIWSSTTHNEQYGWYKELHYMLDNVGRYFTNKRDGIGVRCLKD